MSAVTIPTTLPAERETLIMASNGGIQVLPPGAGYGIVVGIGGVFALMMLGLTWLQNRYVGDLYTMASILTDLST